MMARIYLVCLSLLSVSMTAKPDIMTDGGPPNPPPRVIGSLSLIYSQSQTNLLQVQSIVIIPYFSLVQGCKTTNLPLPYKKMKFERLELAHGEFVLYSGRNGKGTSKLVFSSGDREYSVEEIGFSVVKSVKMGRGEVSFHLPRQKSERVNVKAFSNFYGQLLWEMASVQSFANENQMKPFLTRLLKSKLLQCQ